MGRAFLFLLAIPLLTGADWPEWRGTGRRGVWTETGLLDRFPATGLRVKWSVPIRAGYSGPAVAAGRVFLLDHERGAGRQVTERILALDELTGKLLWSREWLTNYSGLEYDNGPRATPTVDAGRVYVLGAMGKLLCLRAADGTLVWKREFVREYGTEVPAWGMSSAPLVDGNRLIAVVGGAGAAKVVAFDKYSGKELWRALSSVDSEPGYSQPVIIEAGGRRQLIVWHATAIDSLDPVTGARLWTQPFRVRMNTPITTPAWQAPYLLVSAFFSGSRMMEMAADGPEARLAWASSSESEIKSDKLHALMSQPVIEDGYVYGICSYGQLRCLRLATGERVWETQAVTVERARNVSAWIVRNGDRYLFWNDRGELISGLLSPDGYEEISRVKVLKPTSPAGSRREFGAVNWSHPAFANGHLIARNDEVVVRVSLDPGDYE